MDEADLFRRQLVEIYYGEMFISPISRSTNALHTTELVAEASPSQSFFCFVSVSILTLFLKGSSANALVALVPITDPINNTIEGISMVLELRFIVFLQNF